MSALPSPTGLSPSPAGLSRTVPLALLNHVLQSEPRDARIPVWALSIPLAATLEIEFSFFSSGYLDVSVHRVPSAWLWIHHAVTEVPSAGFPHSDICGSSLICSSPQLFAAYHVFLRLLVPRHPPCALSSLTCQALFQVLSGRIALRPQAGLVSCSLVSCLFQIPFGICLGCLVYLVLQTLILRF